MKKINLLIAALHAGALAFTAAPGHALAQDAQEIRAYMHALSLGTAEAMTSFLLAYPNSALPGSELGASIAAGVDQPTAAVATDGGQSAGNGRRENDSNRDTRPRVRSDDGIY